MRSIEIDARLAERLFRESALKWDVPPGSWLDALAASAARAFESHQPSPRELERYLKSLHLDDVALACACAAGNEAAWEHFIREQRPVLYRAADAIDPGGGARELADSLYADLYGLGHKPDGERQSLFRYFHGRSSLATWLRAVLAQRHVDRIRSGHRLEPLPDEDVPSALLAPARPVDPDRLRYAGLLECALARAVGALTSRERLRLGCYYAQRLTLAEIGRMLDEHEATVSRHLARTRRALRASIEDQLRREAGLSDDELREVFESVMNDPGTLDVSTMLASPSERKDSARDRSER